MWGFRVMGFGVEGLGAKMKGPSQGLVFRAPILVTLD